MNDLLNPCQLYFDTIEKKVLEQSENFFNELLTKSQVNVEENKVSASKYEESERNLHHTKYQLTKYKRVEKFLLFFIIFFSLVRAIYLAGVIYKSYTNLAVFIPVYVVLFGLTIFFIIYLSTKNRRRIINLKKDHKKHEAESKANLKECNKQMAPLLSLFDSSDPDNLLMKVTPLIKLDPVFDIEKLAYLHDVVGLPIENKDTSSSITYAKTGTLKDIPFMILKTRNYYMSSKTYTGTRVVSYQVSYIDSEGRRRTTTRVETLIATVVKPCPAYYSHETLYYGNKVADKLSFNRKPFYINKVEEGKPYERYIEKQMKLIQKQKKKSSSFVELNNDEFEVLFHALDRDNEQEFRLLFTPLGQKSMVSLIKNSPYGDDFSFVKEKKINMISASHTLITDRSCDPTNYYTYSVELCKKEFVSYCSEYFKSFYFELAPLLAIPIYQQMGKENYTFNSKKYPYNFSLYEHEVISNQFNRSDISSSQTEVICKTKYKESIGSWDIFDVTANGFSITKKVDMIPRIAGNGRTYLVPVPWDEYNPISDTNTVAVLKTMKKDKEIYSSYFKNDFEKKISTYVKNNSYSYARNKVFFLLSRYNPSIEFHDFAIL